jgi:DNA-binding NtrC family response regulator
MASSTIAPHVAPRIIVITADEALIPSLEESLVSVFHTTVLNPSEPVLAILAETPVEAALVDLDAADGSTYLGLDIVQQLRGFDPTLVVFGLTRSRSKAVRASAQKSGTSEFFVAPVDFSQLQVVLQHALETRRRDIHRLELQEKAVSGYSFCGLIGGSEPMRRVYDAIGRVADGSATVLVRGESGTGKELVAQAVVASGNRRDKPFISVNCAALPESLIEAELFGHEKGSFTGAHESRAGHIEAANSGTLFLDEIGTLGLGLQSKLLRVLEQRVVQRIGAKAGKKIDFRLICATNEDLETAVKAGRFREDLYYRINVVPIALPPLRERQDDIALLVDHFLKFYSEANSFPLKRIDTEALGVLEDHPWPGNVRELENLVQRLVLMVPDATITMKHLPQQILYASNATQEALLIPEQGISFDEEIARIEVAYLQAALRRTGGRKTAAATLLRMDRQKMKYLCRKYRLSGQ